MVWTHGRTSCTRRMCAPASSASVLRTVVPVRLSAGVVSMSLYIMDLRDKPTRTGRLRVCSCWRSARSW